MLTMYVLNCLTFCPEQICFLAGSVQVMTFSMFLIVKTYAGSSHQVSIWSRRLFSVCRIWLQKGKAFYENQVIAFSSPPGKTPEIQRNSRGFIQVSQTTCSLSIKYLRIQKKPKHTENPLKTKLLLFLWIYHQEAVLEPLP